MLVDTLIDRTCKVAFRKDGPKAVDGRIIAAWLGQPRTEEYGGLTFIHTIMVAVELFNFDKGRVYELPIEWVVLDEMEGRRV